MLMLDKNIGFPPEILINPFPVDLTCVVCHRIVRDAFSVCKGPFARIFHYFLSLSFCRGTPLLLVLPGAPWLNVS